MIPMNVGEFSGTGSIKGRVHVMRKDRDKINVVNFFSVSLSGNTSNICSYKKVPGMYMR